MQVILRETIYKLGNQGQIVNVKPGYARNYLIPQKLAMSATPSNLKVWEMEAKSRDRKTKKMALEIEQICNNLEGESITIAMAAGDEEQLYGSVTVQHIIDELQAKGYKQITKSHIIMSDHIKKLGVYDIPIKMDSSHQATIKVWVVRQ